ncbi:hypothetical protein ACJJIQ_11160 [Microbulbifer sp. ANSA003]|uniref:hypothetical protein n=1 Tax=Microbulbifer sp. ANSA003 TaxID=3243360 RepID=UPI0040416928
MLEFIAMSAIAGTNCHYEGPFLVKGLAYDPDNQQLQYCEYYTSQDNGEITVFYYAPQGDLIAEKTLRKRNGPAAGRSALLREPLNNSVIPLACRVVHNQGAAS